MAFDRNSGGSSSGSINEYVAKDSDYTITGAWTYSGVNDFTGSLRVNGTAISATAAEINILDGVTATTAELNALDGFVQGDWTPTIVDDAGTDKGQTYNAQYGKYTRIGNLILISGEIWVTSLGTLSGNLHLEGLPLTSSNTSTVPEGSVSMGHSTGLAVTAGTCVTGFIAQNVTRITLRQWSLTTGSASFTDAVAGTPTFRFEGSYHVD